jgi:Na+-transporting NADH:ubiquinone oxidoreductase subunit NqrB
MIAYSPWAIIFSASFITVICWISNRIFARAFNAPLNVESIYITALILALIIAPPSFIFPLSSSHSFIEYLSSLLPYFTLAIWTSVWAMASKFIFAIGKKHLLNPAAFAVALTALTTNQSANWWVGSAVMAPFVLVGGLLVVRKIRRFDLVLSFIFISVLSITTFSILGGSLNLPVTLERIFLETPLLFFAFIMLTEPLTTPPTKNLRITYGALVGFLFIPTIHVAGIYSTPELALLVGNVFSYLISPKQKLLLKLKNRIQLSRDSFDFVFERDSKDKIRKTDKKSKKISFRPGQYLEWTLPHSHPDSRGNRRYFTIASSPTENEIRIGVKIPKLSDGRQSSFKKRLLSMKEDDSIVASQLAGDFVLPKNGHIPARPNTLLEYAYVTGI